MVDSGYSNHMTHETTIFKNLDKSFKSRVKLSNGEYINVKGKGVITVETLSSTKFIHDTTKKKKKTCCNRNLVTSKIFINKKE